MAPTPRAVPFMQVIRTTYFRGKGPQRTRKVILITFINTIAVPDAYVAGIGFVEGNVTGTPAVPIPMNLAKVIPEPITDATVRVVSPSILAPGVFGSTFLALFNAASQIQLDILAFNPTTKDLGIKCVGARVATTGPTQEPVAAGPAGVPVVGTLVFEIEYTSSR